MQSIYGYGEEVHYAIYSTGGSRKGQGNGLADLSQKLRTERTGAFGGSTYCTRTHDSLKISNGKWCWFSRGIGGKTALDYLIKVREIPFTEAVEMIVGQATIQPPTYAPVPKKTRPRFCSFPRPAAVPPMRSVISPGAALTAR